MRYFRDKFNTKIAMHYGYSGMVEHGDMFWNRKRPNLILRMIAKVMFKLKVKDRFKPDFFIDENFDLTGYNIKGRIIHVPGHSKGSISLLINDDEVICGDLFENNKEPTLNSIMDDSLAAKSSVEKLREFKINTVYPGHGKKFVMNDFYRNYGMDKK